MRMGAEADHASGRREVERVTIQSNRGWCSGQTNSWGAAGKVGEGHASQRRL